VGARRLFTNVVLNVIVLTGLCLHVVNLPADIVYGRILPALGIALPLGNLYYAYLAWWLAKNEGRNDVTAMPYGPSVVYRRLPDHVADLFENA
jgi:AGZA family xanthine/uracil permease-like MFS transporter